MKTRFLIAAAIALTSVTALAGSKLYYNVAIYTSASEIRAVGDIATVRNSADTAQYIFCELQAWATSGTSQVMCAASKTDGTSLYCYSTNEELKKAVAAITPNTLLGFYVHPSAPTLCTRISVKTGSQSAVSTVY